MKGSENGFLLTFSRRYSMAHRLNSGIAPNCQIPHGHDEVVTIDIGERNNASLDKTSNMLVEFSRIKGRWFNWIDNSVDHSFQLGNEDPLIGYFEEREPHLLPHLMITPGDPTTEIRAACFAAKLTAFLGDDHPNFICTRLRIQETPTNSVDYFPQELPGVVSGGADHWWNRPDSSINDLPIAA